MFGTETGKRISTVQVSKFLHAWGFVDQPFTTDELKRGVVKGVGDETYGKDSRLYIYTGTVERRADLERKLHREGLRFSPTYHPGSGTVEIAVTFFRGHNWDE